MQQELTEAKGEMVESQTRISKLCKKMDQQKNDFQVEHLATGRTMQEIEGFRKGEKAVACDAGRSWYLSQQPNS